MAGTTTLGYPYPEDSDPVSDGASTATDLAQAVNDNIGRVYAGTAVAALAASSTATTTINFPSGRFTGAPVVVAMTTDRNYGCNLVSAAAGTAVVRVNRLDGTNVTGNVTIDVIAVQQ